MYLHLSTPLDFFSILHAFIWNLHNTTNKMLESTRNMLALDWYCEDIFVSVLNIVLYIAIYFHYDMNDFSSWMLCMEVSKALPNVPFSFAFLGLVFYIFLYFCSLCFCVLGVTLNTSPNTGKCWRSKAGIVLMYLVQLQCSVWYLCVQRAPSHLTPCKGKCEGHVGMGLVLYAHSPSIWNSCLCICCRSAITS